tara:strand:- start:98 stop:334 length:237 start_codon:yes stop_codon:yes gene_type:complete
MSDKKNNCYKSLFERLDFIEGSLDKLYDCVAKLKKSHHEEDEEEEVCPDEIEGNKAAMDAIRDICLESLLDVEPKGDA